MALPGLLRRIQPRSTKRGETPRSRPTVVEAVEVEVEEGELSWALVVAASAPAAEKMERKKRKKKIESGDVVAAEVTEVADFAALNSSWAEVEVEAPRRKEGCRLART